MTPILGVTMLILAKKLLQTSEHILERLLYYKCLQIELEIVQFKQRQVLLSFCFFSRYFHSLLAEFSFY